ncbi:MAG: hypothetical protein WCQ72_08660 [Eubacteriales bacterium]
MKKITAALILAAMLIAMASCGSQSDSGNTSVTKAPDADAQTTAAEETDSRLAVKEDLPASDFGGYSFRILTRDADHHLKEVQATEENGETINDAVFRRNRAVEEKYNVKLEIIAKSEDDESLLTNFFKKSVLAGDDAFDLALPHMVHAGTTATEGVMYNWLNLKYVDFTKPWWNGSLVDELTVNDKLFLASSDFCISAIDYAWSMVANNAMCDNYGVENVYDMVNNGSWTIDKFTEICSLASSDLNGDGKFDYQDQYGFTTHFNSAINNWMYALDQKVTVMDDSGYPELVINCDKMTTIVNKVYSLLYEDNRTLYVNDAVQSKLGASTHDDAVSGKFAAGETMFAALRIYVIDNLRSMDADFSIIPFPKYDEAQTDYYTHVDGHAPLMAVPNTITDSDRTGIIIEALSAESYRQVVPAELEIVLQSKFARDAQSYEMLERILDGRVFTFAYIYDGWKGMQWSLTNLMSNKNKDFSSYYAKQEKAALKQIETVMDAYNNITE